MVKVQTQQTTQTVYVLVMRGIGMQQTKHVPLHLAQQMRIVMDVGIVKTALAYFVKTSIRSMLTENAANVLQTPIVMGRFV